MRAWLRFWQLTALVAVRLKQLFPSFSVRGEMATVLQVVGMVAITAGAFLFSFTAGLVVGGLFLLVTGFALGK
jgi:hypothetical protein